MGLAGEEGSDTTPQVRRRLALIQAHSELLLESASTTEERDALAHIHRSTLELESLVAPGHEAADPSPDDKMNRVLVCSQSEYLTRTLEAIPPAYGDLELLRTTTKEETASMLAETDVDHLLVDAVWPDATGVDVVGDLARRESVPPYTLVSLATDPQTPVVLVLSGICSPTIPGARLERLFGEYVDTPESPTIAGLFSDNPGGAVGEIVAGHPDTVVAKASDVAARVTPSEMSADAICLDATVYRALSPKELTALRTVTPGRGRPLVLVAPTDGDPSDRRWIPTLGHRKFLHRPPTLPGLFEALFVDRIR